MANLMTASDKQKVCLGVIIGAVGVRGEVRVKPFTAAPNDIAAYGPVELGEGGDKSAIRIVRLAKDGVVAKLESVSDRDVAEALKGTELYVGRDDLPQEEEDEYYYADLVGLKVEDLSGKPLGTVLAVFDFGAGEMLEVKLEEGRAVMFPFTKEAVPEVNLSEGRLVVDPPEGALPEPKKEKKKRKKRDRDV